MKTYSPHSDASSSAEVELHAQSYGEPDGSKASSL